MSQLESIVPEDAMMTDISGAAPDHIFSDLEHPERTAATRYSAPTWRGAINREGVDRSVIGLLLWHMAGTGRRRWLPGMPFSFFIERLLETWAREPARMLEKATGTEADCVSEKPLSAGTGVALLMEHVD